MNVFDLFAKITLDTKGYEQSLEGAKKDTNTFASSLGSGMKKAVKTGVAAVGAVTAATTVAAKKVLSNAKATAQYGDSVDKMSQKVGMTAEAYQEWDYVMQISGTEMSSMTTGLKTLTNKFDDAKKGTQSAVETFEALGLSMEDIEGLSREDLFAEVISAFQGMEDSAERAALANDLFGRSGQELAPLLNTSREETEKLKNEARQYGAVLSNEAVKQSATFQDRLTRMSKAMSGVKNNISASFLPGLTQIVEGLADVASGSDGANEALSEGFSSVITSFSEKLPKVIEIGGKIIKAIADGVMKNLPSLAKTGTTMIIDFAKYIVQALPGLVSSGAQILGEIISSFTEALPQLIPMAKEAILAIIRGLTENAGMLINGAVQLFSGLIQGFSQALPGIVKELPKLIKEIVVAIGDNFGTIATEILPAVLGVSLGKTLLGGVKSLLSGGGVSGLVTTLFSGPGGIVAAAVGGVLLLQKALDNHLKEIYNTSYENARKMTDKQQALLDKIHEEANKWDEIKKARKEAAAGVDETVKGYKELWARLKDVVDEQGNVKAGYEEEAKLIAGELSENLGVEIDLVDGQIKNYKELCKQINTTIEKKRAELMLAAFEEDYTDAIKNRTEARSRLVEAEREYNEAMKTRAEKEAELEKAEQRLRDALAYGPGYMSEYGESTTKMEEKIAALRGELDGATEKVEIWSAAIDESKKDLKESARTITNYDDALEAAAKGSVVDMRKSLDIMTNSMKTAKNSTVGELKQQTSAFYAEYQKQTEAVKNGGGKAAREAQAEAKKLLNLSVKELEKLDPATAKIMKEVLKEAKALYPDLLEAGKNSGRALAKGLKATAPVIKEAARSAMSTAISTAKQVAQIKSPSKVWRDQIGAMLGEGLALGLDDSEGLVRTAAENLIDTASGGYDAGFEVVGSGQDPAANGIIINVYGASGQDVGALADEVAIRLQHAYRREVAKYA